MSDKVLVLGLGNDLLSDDGVGLYLAKQVKDYFIGQNEVEIVETSEMGLSLLDFMVGYRQVVIIDAVQTVRAPPGFLHEFEASELKTLPEISPHFLGVGEVLALGKTLGMAVPHRVKILAVEVNDPFTLSTTLTPVLHQSMPAILDRVVASIKSMMIIGVAPG